MRRTSHTKAATDVSKVVNYVEAFGDNSDPKSIPHVFGDAMRTNLVRVVAGGMLLSATASALAVTTFQHDAHTAPKTAACAVSAAICLVAFYHYAKIIDLRRHSHATADQHVDAVRYSDWLVTLPALALEINLVRYADDTRTALDESTFWAGCLAGVVLLGGTARFGTDEFAPPPSDETATRKRAQQTVYLGMFAYLVAFGLLIPITIRAHDRDYNLTFIVPWFAYGFLASVVGFANYNNQIDYQSLNIIKDVGYGLLDLWSKAILGLWTTAKCLGFI